MRRRSYIINGEYFKTKEAIRKRLRDMLYAYDSGTRVSEKDSGLLSELLQGHPNADEKIGCGVAAFEVREESSISRCFYVIRVDGSAEDFSYKKLLSPPTRLAVFKSICRSLVYQQIYQFKSSYFRDHARVDGSVECPIMHKWVTQDQTHVDHIPPNTFRKLVTGFIRQNDINVDKVEIRESEDKRAINKTFTDTALAENWVKYHDMNAKLRVVSAYANLNIIPLREKALDRISNHYDLSLVYELEPERTENLVDMALECIVVGEQKASALADLEMYATRLVGSNAVHPLLRSEVYEIMLYAFLDWLLTTGEMEAVG